MTTTTERAPAPARKTLTLRTPAQAAKPMEAEEAKDSSGAQANAGTSAAPAKKTDRSRAAGDQLLRCGEIKPNPGTVFGTIFDLVTELDTVSRTRLAAAMATAQFASPKAKPADPTWCKGYIAGALREGFLAVATFGPRDSNDVQS